MDWRKFNTSGNVKLTPTQVYTIRCQFKNGISVPMLATAYGVSYNCISDIVTGRSWKDVSGPVVPSVERSQKYFVKRETKK